MVSFAGIIIIIILVALICIYYKAIYKEIRVPIETIDAPPRENIEPFDTDRKIYLIIPYYRDMKRQSEIDFCLENNITNPHIDHIIAVVEPPATIPFNSDKIIPITQESRAEFKDLFTYANDNCPIGSIVIISNSDICFDNTISKVKSLKIDEAIALSRWDIDITDTTVQDLKKANNLTDYFHFDEDFRGIDTWIFTAPIRNVKADFFLGKPFCDFRINYEMKMSGYKIYNPIRHIHSFHVHMSNIRHYVEEEYIEGGAAMVLTTKDWK